MLDGNFGLLVRNGAGDGVLAERSVNGVAVARAGQRGSGTDGLDREIVGAAGDGLGNRRVDLIGGIIGYDEILPAIVKLEQDIEIASPGSGVTLVAGGIEGNRARPADESEEIRVARSFDVSGPVDHPVRQ